MNNRAVPIGSSGACNVSPRPLRWISNLVPIPRHSLIGGSEERYRSRDQLRLVRHARVCGGKKCWTGRCRSLVLVVQLSEGSSVVVDVTDKMAVVVQSRLLRVLVLSRALAW